MKRESVEIALASTKDIFVGAFRCTPFLNGYSMRRHHCETKHENVDITSASAGDIFVGAFRCTPFLNRRSARSQMSCFDDLHAASYRKHWKHINERKPAAVLLSVMDHEEVSLRYRAVVSSFMLNDTSRSPSFITRQSS